MGGKWGRGKWGMESIITCYTIEIGLKNGMSKVSVSRALTTTLLENSRGPFWGRFSNTT